MTLDGAITGVIILFLFLAGLGFLALRDDKPDELEILDAGNGVTCYAYKGSLDCD